MGVMREEKGSHERSVPSELFHHLKAEQVFPRCKKKGDKKSINAIRAVCLSFSERSRFRSAFVSAFGRGGV